MNTETSYFDNQPFTVNAASLVPTQRPTSPALMVQCDYYEQVMLKHPKLSFFHSLSELYNAALMESDPDITSYVPQPFLLTVNGRRYTPDLYLVRKGQRIIQEIKPMGVFDIGMQVPLEDFFDQNQMTFEVVSNESIFARKEEAENWLEIIRVLITTQIYNTQHEEREIIWTLDKELCTPISHFIDPGARESTYLYEIAIFRLIHRGKLHANLTSHSIDYDTELTLCV